MIGYSCQGSGSDEIEKPMSKIEELRAAAYPAARLGERSEMMVPLATALAIVTEQEQRIAELQAELIRREYFYPHMCRDGHEEIGWRGDSEVCPIDAALEASKPAEGHWYYCLTCDEAFKISGTFSCHRTKECHSMALYPSYFDDPDAEFAEPAEGTWQPIATAAPDQVGLFWMDYAADVHSQDGFPASERVFQGKRGCWSSIYQATHWRPPLPAPPATEPEKES